jgi:nicotinamide-nucleotide amidase
LAVTGVAGPTGGTEEKPVGLVYIALSSAEDTAVAEKHFRGDRLGIREWTTQQALDLIRRLLR